MSVKIASSWDRIRAGRVRILWLVLGAMLLVSAVPIGLYHRQVLQLSQEKLVDTELVQQADLTRSLAREKRGTAIHSGFMTGYDFHPDAAVDLDEIWDFIAEDNLDAADRVIQDVLSRIDKLVPFPDQGHKRPDLTSRPLRFAVVHEYLIAYAPDENPLWVIAVIHGRRSPRVMAAILRGRK